MPMSPRLLRPRAAAFAGFDPRSISGLTLWLDAADASSVVLDANSRVSAWNDKSGNGRHFTQTSAAARPRYNTTVNGRQVIRALSTEGNPSLTRPGAANAELGGPGGATLLFVFNLPSESASYTISFFGDAPNNFDRFSDGATYASRLRGSLRAGSFALGMPTSGTCLHAIISDVSSGNQTFRRQPFLTTASTSAIGQALDYSGWLSKTSQTYTIGAGGPFLHCEILFYNRPLSSIEIAAVEDYLMTKWGLNSPPAYADADVNNYIIAVETADRGRLETGVRDAINDFIVGCKADGVWPAIKASCILMGARTLSGALTPLAGSAPTNSNFVSGDYNRKTGLVGNGTNKALNTNRNQNADPQNNFHMAVYVTTAATSSAGVFPVYIGHAGGEPGSSQVFRNENNGSLRGRNRAGDFQVSANGGVTGLLAHSRASSGSVNVIASGAVSSISSVSGVPFSGNSHVFYNGMSGVTFANGRLAFYSVGESLSLSSLNSRIDTLYAAIGAAIP